MKAAFITQTGPPENIQYGDLPDPTPGQGQVLVKVEAVAVNPVDTYVRSGMVAMNLPMPFIIGADLAGVVAAVGPGATRFKVGDRVWGSNQGLLGRQGTFAELAAVDEQWLYPTPKEMDSRTAAALALVGITGYLGLVRDAKLQAGETIFVNGGTGGVGSTVVQMSKALGARVITTSGSPEKTALARQLGADVAICYKTDDVDARIKEAAPKGVNIWWETLREPNFDRSVSLLAHRGRMVIIAGREYRPQFPVGPFYVKGLALYGFAMFNESPQDQRDAAEWVNKLVVEGKLKARIDRVLPLSKAAEAHRLQEENTLKQTSQLAGKLVLEP